jgi:hypothetical protein
MPDRVDLPADTSRSVSANAREGYPIVTSIEFGGHGSRERSRPPRAGGTAPVKLDGVRNNVQQPTLGHVVMFGAVSAGWLVLFLVNLVMGSAGPGWWIRAVFSGVLLVGSAVFTVVLWRRFSRANKRT